MRFDSFRGNDHREPEEDTEEDQQDYKQQGFRMRVRSVVIEEFLLDKVRAHGPTLSWYLRMPPRFEPGQGQGPMLYLVHGFGISPRQGQAAPPPTLSMVSA